jgi:hypothetical protein
LKADETRNVSLTAEMNNFIRDQVASDRYQTPARWSAPRSGCYRIANSGQNAVRRPSPNRTPIMDAKVTAGRSDFFAGGGQLGAMMRAHDWSSSPLGPPDL